MRFFPKIRPQGWGAPLGALLTSLAGLALYQLPRGRAAEQLSYDLLFLARPTVALEGAIIVYLDEDSHDELKQSYNRPWDRKLHARLVRQLTAAGAKAIVFDIVFSDPGPDPDADEEFAAAIKASGRVVLAADMVPTAYGVDGVAAKRMIPPVERFSEAAGAIGSAEMAPDSDLTSRRHLAASTDDLLPSLSWAAAQFVHAPATATEDSRFQQRWLNYYGPPDTVANISYYRALNENRAVQVLFRDKIVFVGSRMLTKFSGERKDEYRTPYSFRVPQKPFMSGVEIQATMFLNLYRGDWLSRFPASVERWLLVGFGLLAGYGLARRRALVALSATVVACVGTGLSAWLLIEEAQVWFPWFILLGVQLPLALVWSLSFNTLRLFFENRLLGVTLGQHLSPERVKELLRTRDVLRPGAVKTELTIMFTDIADFSAISEHVDSDELARMMNDYFDVAITCVYDTDGFLVKLIGDALFVIWNAPIAQDDHRARAVRASLLLQERFSAFNARTDRPALITRIGIHTGVANVGNFGSAQRFDYTAIGEAINLASRMEGLNKHLGTRVLVTNQTVAPLDGQMDLRALGEFRLKGFEKAVSVYEVIGPLESADTTRPWRELFAQGLEQYRQKEFTQARSFFEAVLEKRPLDGPSLFYIGLMSEVIPELMPENWTGEIEIREK